jgi:ribosomal protein S20
MTNQEEYLKNVEISLSKRLGNIVTRSILKNNLAKIDKEVTVLTREDCKGLVENIVKAVSLFETQDEAQLVRSELEHQLRILD